MEIKIEKKDLSQTTIDLVEFRLQDNPLDSRSIYLLIDFMADWVELIDSGYFSITQPLINSFEYQIQQWYQGWSTGFEQEIKQVQGSEFQFRYLEVLDYILVQTQKFLLTSTEKEEREIFGTTWIFERTVPYQAQWLTEQTVGIKNQLLPCYLPIALKDFTEIEHLSYWTAPFDQAKDFNPYYDKRIQRNQLYKAAAQKNLLALDTEDSYTDIAYSQTLGLLQKAFLRLKNHPEYQNKTYQGWSFAKAVEEFLTVWINLVYGCTSKSSSKKSFEYKFRKWIEWAHRITLWASDALFKGIPFQYPEILDLILEQTEAFLNADTWEEKDRIINTQYIIFKFQGQKKEHLTKMVWLTQENLNFPGFSYSDLLPGYYPYDVTDRLRGKKLEEFCLKQLQKTPQATAQWLDYDKYTWEILDRAIEKGLIINNYKEE